MGTSQTGTPKPGEESGTNDRRKALRRKVVDSYLVTVDLAFQSGALVLDLSETGIGVQALSTPPMGERTSVQFDLPETGGRVQAMGRIAWTDNSGRLGIRFDELPELSRINLAQWLSRERQSVIASSAGFGMPTWPPMHARDEIAALRRDLATERLEGDAAMAFTVERVRNVTRATGAAIALEDGNAVVCRASSGNAPPPGACLDPNSGLSGECMRTGEIVRCEDTETDPRADRLVCRKLELRSIVIVPIRIQGRPAGVLEAFSSRAHAFLSSDVLLLRRVSDLVAAISVRQADGMQPYIDEPQAVIAATSLEPSVVDVPEEEEKPLTMEEIFRLAEDMAAPAAAPEVAKSQPASWRQPGMVAQDTARIEPLLPKQNVAAARTVLPQPAPVVVEKDRFEPAVSVESPKAKAVPPIDVAPASRVVSDIDHAPSRQVVAPVERAAAVEKVEHPAPRQVVLPAESSAPSTMKTPERPAPPVVHKVERPAPPVAHKVEHRAPPLVAPISHPAPMADTGFSNWGMAAAAAPTTARVRPVPLEVEDEDAQEAPSQAIRDAMLASMAQRPSPWKMRIAGAAIMAAVLAIGGWQVWRAVGPPKATPVGPEVEMKEEAPAASPTTNPAALVRSADTTVVTAAPTNAAPAIKPGAAARAKPAGPRSAANGSWPQDDAGPELASPAPMEIGRAEVPEGPPAITAIARPAGSSAISNVLGAPVPTPKFDRPVVSEMSGGKLLKRFDPAYPPSASGLHGEVVLKATIDKDGRVSQVRIVSGHALLAQAAAAALKRWRYEPFRLNGVPIEVENTIVVNFKAPRQ